MVVANVLASTFRGPHIAFLPGRVTCPLAGVGTRAANESNRLVVDDPATRVTIDIARDEGARVAEGATITLEDDRRCAQKTVIADFVWLAEGPAPFTIHLEVFKSGHAWSIDLHTHEPAPLTDRRRARYEPFTIIGIDNGRREVLVDPSKLAHAVAHVPLARRLSSKLMTMRDHLRDETAGQAVFDRSIGIGALGRGSFLVRARLVRLDDPARVQDLTSTRSETSSSTPRRASPRAPASDRLATMLADGHWELSIEALTDRYLPEIVARDLRLYGLAEIPLLAELAAGRLRKGQTLAFRTTDEVRLDDRSAPLANARDLARTYIEIHMLGGIIAAALR